MEYVLIRRVAKFEALGSSSCQFYALLSVTFVTVGSLENVLVSLFLQSKPADMMDASVLQQHILMSIKVMSEQVF